ncbi:MAG: HD domain-containing protein [Eggerthellaceae bacterium]|nr:HD domain-containing protein [Eggerthellaceae bacterium]
MANARYLNLDEAVAGQILEDRATKAENPSRFNDQDVVRRESNPHDVATLTRPAFGRDIEKIINMPAYSRYTDKTQVFSLTPNDDISRRGLHVQLVSRIARNIGAVLGLNIDLIEAIALGHDTGHTPFGHAGERFLNKAYHAHTGRYFNHNVHSVRVLDKLFRRNISLQTLDGVLCHNGEFEQQSLGLGALAGFEEFDGLVERCYRDEATIDSLRPSTLEGCVVRVSDMIAYLGKDRQDAIEMGLISSLECFDSTVIGVSNAQMINNLTVDIINNSYRKDHISLSEGVFADLKRAKEQNYRFIYNHEGVISGAGNIVEEMFSDMYERLLADCQARDLGSPLFRHHIRNLVSKSKMVTEEGYLKEDPNQIVVDYMASMTDSYFIALFEFLFPEKGSRIVSQGYHYSL